MHNYVLKLFFYDSKQRYKKTSYERLVGFW